MSGDRVVAGLRCTEVLEKLSDYIDGALDAPTRSAVEAHVAGCTVCESFGGSVAASVRALRRQRNAGADESIERMRAAVLGKITT
ncbi:MAG: zf-HC2 domain-containing protein [Myxococcales bacterium]|nr:zf-HC2 domain-containing protein [Myxococcales bacterium]